MIIYRTTECLQVIIPDGHNIAIGDVVMIIKMIIWKPTKIMICIGEESFEHANVLSEKINFSALGGPGVAIFGPDDLHPMY